MSCPGAGPGDKALASFVVIQAALKRSRRLWAYTQREDLNMRMPNFAVSARPYLLVAESAEPLHHRCFSVLQAPGMGETLPQRAVPL